MARLDWQFYDAPESREQEREARAGDRLAKMRAEDASRAAHAPILGYEENAWFESFDELASEAIESGDARALASALARPAARHIRENGAFQRRAVEMALRAADWLQNEEGSLPAGSRGIRAREDVLRVLLDWEEGLSARPEQRGAPDFETSEPLAQRLWSLQFATATRMALERGGWRGRNQDGRPFVHVVMSGAWGSGGSEESVKWARLAIAAGASWLDLDQDGLTAIERAAIEGLGLEIGAALDEIKDFSPPEMESQALAAFSGALAAWDAPLAKRALDAGARGWVQKRRDETPWWTEGVCERALSSAPAALRGLGAKRGKTAQEARLAGPQASALWALLQEESLIPGANAEFLWRQALAGAGQAVERPAVFQALSGAANAGLSLASASPSACQAIFKSCERVLAKQGAGSADPGEGWAGAAALARSAWEANSLRAEVSRGLGEKPPKSAADGLGKGQGAPRRAPKSL